MPISHATFDRNRFHPFIMADSSLPELARTLDNLLAEIEANDSLPLWTKVEQTSQLLANGLRVRDDSGTQPILHVSCHEFKYSIS